MQPEVQRSSRHKVEMGAAGAGRKVGRRQVGHPRDHSRSRDGESSASRRLAADGVRTATWQIQRKKQWVKFGRSPAANEKGLAPLDVSPFVIMPKQELNLHAPLEGLGPEPSSSAAQCIGACRGIVLESPLEKRNYGIDLGGYIVTMRGNPGQALLPNYSQTR